MVRALETLHALGALDGDARLARPYGTQVHSWAVCGEELWVAGVDRCRWQGCCWIPSILPHCCETAALLTAHVVLAPAADG